MESITIDVAEGKYPSSKAARRDGQIPMIYYAKDVEPRQYTTDYQTFRRAYNKAGMSTIINLKDEKGDDHQVLVHDIQYDPVSDDIMHVDLKAIKKGQKISTDIRLVFVGESKAVNEEDGIFTASKDKVTVECLPKDLVHEIEVDISPLEDFHTSITVGDIQAPEGITILDAEDINVASVSAPRIEEEPVVAEGEEGEEGAEGEGAEGEGAEGEGGEAPAEEKKEEGGEASE